MTETTREDARPRITLRGFLLGVLTIAATFYFISRVSVSGHFAMSQFPMAVFIPFVLWLFLNILLKLIVPALALRKGELLTILIMLWVVGGVPIWLGYWALILASPTYYASHENGYAEAFFDYLPWHLFPTATERVIDPFFLGLRQGAGVPWEAWTGPLAQWFGVSMAMVIFGFCVTVLFQRQWEQHEKLTFPLAQVPVDLLRGRQDKALPALFYTYLFWIGFAVAIVPILYNIVTFFTPGLLEFQFLTRYMRVNLGEWASIKLRYMPIVMTFTYLCPVDILGSLVLFRLLSTLKGGVTNGLGLGVGEEGQQIVGERILFMESYGALMFIACWAVWVARRHLRTTWRMARGGTGDKKMAGIYRMAWAGLILSAVYIVGWGTSLGMPPVLAAATFVLMSLTFFATSKLIAATGFAYLMPLRPFLKGAPVIVDLIGTSHLSHRSITAFRLFTSRAFFGTFVIPVWPALTHHLRIFSLRDQWGWAPTVVVGAFATGFLVAALGSIEGGYLRTSYSMRTESWITGVFWDPLVYWLRNLTVWDWGKIGVFTIGWVEAAVLTFLRARFHWFPLHPVGLAFQGTFGPDLYWSTLAIVWIVKLLLMRYGGVRAYVAGKPFFYGLGIGYVVGVAIGAAVDVVWFPVEGHRLHRW